MEASTSGPMPYALATTDSISRILAWRLRSKSNSRFLIVVPPLHLVVIVAHPDVHRASDVKLSTLNAPSRQIIAVGAEAVVERLEKNRFFVSGRHNRVDWRWDNLDNRPWNSKVR